MRRRLGWVCTAALLLVGCRNMPGPFAPPVQRQPLEDFRLYRMSAMRSAGNLRDTGFQHFEQAVPAGRVTAGQDVTVGADIDKPWIPPQGGPKRGIILMRIGLTQ